jgi:phosphate-selective porin OprO/OprP
VAVAAALFLGALLFCTTTGGADPEAEPPAGRSRFRIDAGWPEGITYEVRKVTPALGDSRPLSRLEEIYLTGRVGVRLDLDAALFDADTSLSGFDDGVRARRVRFYLAGDFRLGLPLAYKFEFSSEGTDVFLNDFYLRWKPTRWVDSVDFGYLTPPMGLENIISSRSLTFMEMAAPVQALAPGFRSGIAVAGHRDRWRTAWKAGLFSSGQEQLSGDASDTALQLVGRAAWRPWREASEEVGAAFAHIGLSASYAVTSGSGIQYRARPESFIAPFVVDTGDTDADNALQYALEGAWTSGPLLISAEALQSFVVDGGGGQRSFWGGYSLVSWILTGEHHPYDPKTGLFERLEPRRPFSFCGDGWGAWEIAQRLAWLDLTDGGVRGGEMLTVASGITWHLNAQLRLFANYVFAHITDGPQNGDASIFQFRIEIGI